MSIEDHEPLSHEWRLAHVAAGDEALARCTTTGQWEGRAALAAAAQAHYAAANVRARPASPPEDATLVERLERLKAMGDPSFGGGL
jgi:hypothetical protein